MFNARHNWVPKPTDESAIPSADTPPIDLTKVLPENLPRIKEEFERIFRRPLDDGDPLFFPFNLLLSEEDMADAMSTFMEEADIHPALQYATKKTGRIVSEANLPLLSEEERAEWESAIEEYRQWVAAGQPIPPKSKFELAIEAIEEEFSRLPFVFSLFLRQAHRLARCGSFNRDLAFFYATKTLKSIQACDALVELNYGEDAMTVARSVFENYLQIVLVVRDPAFHAQWAKARFGLFSGTHEYAKTNKGGVDYSRVREKSSGNTVTMISRSAVAKLSPFDEDKELYSVLYSHLSTYSHPDPVLLGNYVSANGFDAARRVEGTGAHALAYFLATMNLDAILHLGGHPRRPRGDATVLLREIRRRARNVFREMSKISAHPVLQPLSRRIAKIGKPWPA